MDADSAGLARQAVPTLFVLAVAALLGIVLERVGVGVALLGTLATVVILFLAVAPGASGGTMRLPVFLHAGRELPVSAVSLSVATLAAASGGLAPLAAMAALAIWALAIAPVLRRTGVPGLAGGLGHLYRNPPLRVLLALAVGGTALPMAAAHLASASAMLSPLLALSPGATAAMLGTAIALVLVPGGLRGAARATVAMGLVTAFAAAVLLVVAQFQGLLDMARLAATIVPPRADIRLEGLALLALVAAPQLANFASAGRSEGAVREGGLWGALFACLLLIAIALAPSIPSPASQGPVFLPMAQACSRLALDLAATLALVHAGAAALGFELRGRPDRRRYTTSKRFAHLRLATLVATAGVAWASMALPDRIAAWQAPAAALFLATIGPALALAAVIDRPGRWSGLFAAVTGLATTALLLEGRLAPGWSTDAAGLAGFSAGIIVGLLPALVPRQSAAPAPVDDGAL